MICEHNKISSSVLYHIYSRLYETSKGPNDIENGF